MVVSKEKKSEESMNKHKKYIKNLPLLIGALILVNVYFLKLSWLTFIGWILFTAGLCKFFIPYLNKRKKK